VLRQDGDPLSAVAFVVDWDAAEEWPRVADWQVAAGDETEPVLTCGPGPSGEPGRLSASLLESSSLSLQWQVQSSSQVIFMVGTKEAVVAVGFESQKVVGSSPKVATLVANLGAQTATAGLCRTCQNGLKCGERKIREYRKCKLGVVSRH